MIATNKGPDGGNTSCFHVCKACGTEHNGKPLASIPLFPREGCASGTFVITDRSGQSSMDRLYQCVICNDTIEGYD